MVVVDGRKSVVVVVDVMKSVAGVDGRRSGQHHPGGNREAKPGLILSKLILIRGFISRVIHRFGAWYTRLVLLNRYSLYGVYPSLVVL